MSSVAQLPEVSEAEWAATPAAVKALVRAMATIIADQAREIDGLRAQVVRLDAWVLDLKERLKATSRNSSKPPSSDPPALWTFVRVAGIEPTNNTGERRIRPAVMWRKTSFGTHSAAGSRFVERMLTTSATLRQQGRNVVAFVMEALENRLRGTAAPSLLPIEEPSDSLPIAA